MKKSEINAKEFAKMIDKATNFLKKIEESDDIFELDLDSIKKETDELTKELEKKYKDHLDSEK